MSQLLHLVYVFISFQARKLRTLQVPDYVPPPRRTPMDNVQLTPSGEWPIPSVDDDENMVPVVRRIPLVSCTPFSLALLAVLFR